MPWTYDLPNENNKIFIKAFEAAANKKANLFAVLGWETGLLLQALLEQQKLDTPPHQMLAAITSKTFESPRQWLKIDTSSNHTFGPAWLVKAGGNMNIQLIKDLENMEQEWEQFKQQPLPKGESSTWRNTYLCI